MIDENDEAVFADSAYQSEASEAYLHSKGCQNFIMFKARRGHPLSEEEQTRRHTTPKPTLPEKQALSFLDKAGLVSGTVRDKQDIRAF